MTDDEAPPERAPIATLTLPLSGAKQPWAVDFEFDALSGELSISSDGRPLDDKSDGLDLTLNDVQNLHKFLDYCLTLAVRRQELA